MDSYSPLRSIAGSILKQIRNSERQTTGTQWIRRGLFAVVTVVLICGSSLKAEAALTISTGANLGTFPIGRVEVPLIATGGTGSYLWDVTCCTTLPPGMALRTDGPSGFPSTASAGIIGVATTAGTYSFTLRVFSGIEIATRTFTLTIAPISPFDDFTNPPDAFVNSFYSYTFTTLRAGTFTWSTLSALPQNLTLSSSGVLSGTPTTAGTSTLSIRLTDGVNTFFQTVSLRVSDIQITTDKMLPQANQNQPYGPLQLQASGGSGPLIWNAGNLPNVSQSLPSGLVLSPTGILSGTTTFSGYSTFYITATDTSGHFYAKLFTLVTVGTTPTLPYIYTNLNWSDLLLGRFSSFSFFVNQGKGPYSWSASGLPPGLRFVDSGGTDPISRTLSPFSSSLRGVPTQLGSFPVTVNVTDSSSPPVTVSQTIEIRVAALDNDNPASGTSGVPYSSRIRVVGGTSPYQWTIPAGGSYNKLPGGLTLHSDSGVIDGIPLEDGYGGTTYISVQVTDYDGNTLRRSFVPIFIARPAGSTVYVPSAAYNGLIGSFRLNTSFSRTLTAASTTLSPFTPTFVWTLLTDPPYSSSLPPGVTLSSAGLLSGTPTVAGVFSFYVRVADAANPADYSIRQLVMNITTLSQSTSSLPNGEIGRSYSAPLTVSGGTAPFNWVLRTDSNPLPPGLSLVGSPASGFSIAGVPTSAGYYYFYFDVTDSAGNSLPQVFFSVNVYPHGPRLQIGSLGTFSPGRALIQLSAIGGSAPYTYSYADGAAHIPGMNLYSGAPLPNGWSATVTGGFLGIPTVPGTYNSAIRVEDSVHDFYVAPITMTVSSLAATSQTSLPRAAALTPYNYILNADGGTSPYTWAVSPGYVLPTGMNLSSDGVLSGTPSTVGSFGFNIVVTDAASRTYTAFYSLTVTPFAIGVGSGQSSLLPRGTLGTAYPSNVFLTTTGPTVGAATWSLVSTLPAGLTLNPSTGQITGTPTASFSGTVTVRATDSTSQTITRALALQIALNPPAPLSITTSTFGTSFYGDTIAQPLSASGGLTPYTWTLESGTLPEGLSLISGDVLNSSSTPGTTYLAGRALDPGIHNFVLRLTDAGLATVTRTFSYEISVVSSEYTSLPIIGTTLIVNTPYSQRLLGIGGTGTYDWTGSSFPPVLALSPNGTISGTPISSGSSTGSVRLTDTNGLTSSRSLSFNVSSGTGSTINITNANDLGTFSLGSTATITLNATGSPLATPAYVFSLGVGSTLPPGFSLLTGDAVFTTAGATLLAGIPTTPGIYTFSLVATDAAGNLGIETFTLRVTANAIFTPAVLPDGTIGMSYNQDLIAWGSGTWSVTSGTLPLGLVLDSSGILSGTPAIATTSTFTATFTDESGVPLPRSFTLRINAFAIDSPTLLPIATVGVPYSYELSAAGGNPAVTWTGTMPNGLTLSSGGHISGTPLSAISSTISLTATVDAGTASAVSVPKTFSLVVQSPNPTPLSYALSSTLLTNTVVGQNVNAFLSGLSGGLPPYTWSLVTGSELPPGLNLVPPNSSTPLTVFAIAGVPTQTGTYSFTLEATDSAGRKLRRTFTMTVTSVALVPTSLRLATYNAPYSQTLTAAGGEAPYSYGLVASALNTTTRLPVGLSLSPGGAIAGVPLETGSFSFTVLLTDSNGASFTRLYSLTVRGDVSTSVLTLTTSSVDMQVGVYRSSTVTFSGLTQPVFWTLTGALPPGVSFADGISTGSKVLAGRPQTAGIYTFTLNAFDSALTPNRAVRTFTINVSPIQLVNQSPLAQLANQTSPGTVLTYAVENVFFTANFWPTGGVPPYTFNLEPGNYLPDGVTLSSSGVLSGTSALTGIFSFSYTIRDANGARLTTSSSLLVSPVGQGFPPSFLATVLPQGSLNQPFAFRLDSGLFVGTPPFQWALSSGSLPPGLSLIYAGPLTGYHLAGMPTVPGTFAFTLQATSALGQSTLVNFTSVISPIGLTPDALPVGKVGSSLSTVLTPSGGSPSYIVALSPTASLPPGVNFGGGFFGSGLSGTPTTPGRFAGTFTVTDSVGATLTRSYTLNVDSPVSPHPFLTVAPSVINVTYIQGASAPVIPVNVTSSSGTATFNVEVSGVGGAAITPVTTATTPHTLFLTFNSIPAVGVYSGVLGVTSSDSPNSPISVPVVLRVLPPPPCTYAVSPMGTSFPAVGGSGTFSVTAGSSCGWLLSPPSWISLGVSSGSGNAIVNYTVSSNPSVNQRVGSISLTDSVVIQAALDITQFGTTGCSFSIDPVNLSPSASGGSGTISVTSSASSCGWTAVSNDTSWISITAGAAGTGNGSASFDVLQNSGAARSGTITIAGKTFTINQGAAACTVSLSSGGATLSAAGGDGSVDVATGSGCPYNTLIGPSWIVVTSGGAGIGSQTLNFSSAPNSSVQARSGFLVIGGQLFQVTEEGVPCSFTVNGTNPIFSSGGGVGSFTVSSNDSSCEWAASSPVDWITLSQHTSTTQTFTVTSTLLTGPRSATLIIAGQSAPVSQSGITCSYALRSGTGNVPVTGGSGTVGVLAAAPCGWTTSTVAPWLSATPSGSGSQDIQFTADPNPTTTARTAVISFQGSTLSSSIDYVVTQPGNVCSVTLGSGSVITAGGGASGSVSYTPNAGGCTPNVLSYAGWVTTTVTPGSLNFVVSANPSVFMRQGTIQVGDKTFTVNQAPGTTLCTFVLSSYGASFSKSGGNGLVMAGAALGCANPTVGASPELLPLDPITFSDFIWTQPYHVPLYNSLVNYVRMLEITVNGTHFIIKQKSW